MWHHSATPVSAGCDAMSWYLSALRQYATFSGRARRKEYWMFVLFNLLVAVVSLWPKMLQQQKPSCMRDVAPFPPLLALEASLFWKTLQCLVQRWRTLLRQLKGSAPNTIFALAHLAMPVMEIYIQQLL